MDNQNSKSEKSPFSLEGARQFAAYLRGRMTPRRKAERKEQLDRRYFQMEATLRFHHALDDNKAQADAARDHLLIALGLGLTGHSADAARAFREVLNQRAQIVEAHYRKDAP